MAANNASISILLKDKAGFHFKDDGGAPWQCTVAKGELLIEQTKEEIRQIESHKHRPNYRLYRDDEYVVLHCGRLDVSPLTGEELEYLLAVEPIGTRLQEYLKSDEVKQEKLDLVVDDVVMFKMKVKPDAAAHSIAKGVIRYIGPIQGKNGTHFGIEIQEQKYRGKGTSNGDPYFRCGSKDAVFVSIDKITKKSQYPSHEKPAATNATITGEPTSRNPTGTSVVNQKAGAFESQSPFYAGMDIHNKSKFKVDDRVVVKSVKDEVFNGTVKWVGTTRVRPEAATNKKLCTVAAVGVDVEKKIISIDKHFPGGMCLDITGSRNQELFKVPFTHTRLFFPEELGIVLHAEEYATQQQEANALKWEAEKAKEYGLSLEEYRSQKEYLEKANKDKEQEETHQQEAKDLKEAKEYGLSLEDYRTQKEYLQKVDKDKKTHHPKQTGGEPVEERGAAGVGALSQNNKSEKDKMSESMMHLQTGAPLSEERRQQEERAFQLARQQSRHGGGDPAEYEVIKGLEVKPTEDNYLNVDIPENQHGANPVSEDLRKPSPKEGYTSLPSNDTPHQRSPNLRRSPDPPPADYHPEQFHGHDYSNRPHDPSYDHGRNDLRDPLRYPDHHSDLERHRDLPHDSHHPPPDPGDLPGPPPDPYHQFTIDSMVCIDTQKGDPLYGVVKWIGTVPDFNGGIAGVEMEKTINGGTDGTWRGRRFFTCSYGKGYFFPVTALRQDTRYMDEGQVPAHLRQDFDNPLAKYTEVTEETDTIGSPELFNLYIGDRPRGIQGHHNSCYLDSTVFGLFALSDSFDVLLLEKPTEEVGRKVKYFLWKGIVNPLRKYGLARYESIMDLRDSLEEFGRMKGAKTDEKDPEEFLNLLFKEVLHIPPFLTIKRPFGIEKEFFIQLFFEIDPYNTEVPKTEKLIAQMFHEQNISFTRVPSKLLLQMPRFGKEFKMYSKIIPSLTLDVKPLMDPSARGVQKCKFCLRDSSLFVCHTCPKEIFNTDDPYVYYCSECDGRAHQERKGHHVEAVNIRPGTSDATNFSKMELLSVICIETSHYVCYTRAGDKWLFHDSMADRLYDMYNVPRVVDVTAGLQDWIYSHTASEARLMNTPARDIPEYVRRFTQDIYMCVYVNPDLDMYGDNDVEESLPPKQ